MRTSRGIALLLAALLSTAAPAWSQEPTSETTPAQDVATPAPSMPVSAASVASPVLVSDPDRYADILTFAKGDTLESLIAERLSETKDDQRIAAFYYARGNTPIWVTDGRLNDKARAAIARIARADEDGLDADAFILPDAAATDGTKEELAAAEIALSRSAIAYARQAQGGRLVPSSLSPLITAEPVRPEPEAILAVMAANDDSADWLDSYNPPHPQFQALRKKLAELRAEEAVPEVPHPDIPLGKLLRPGMTDDRVPLLRVRFGLSEGADSVYDPGLAEAVRAFQTSAGLTADAMLGKHSIEALNGGPRSEDPIKTILVNMERWRWLPRDLGPTHIMVNVPEFMARIVRNGELAHETRVVTGTVKNQTPIFSDEMEFIIVNPSWNIPESIASKEMLPNLQRDPYYLARQGIEVLDISTKRARPVDPGMIDWSSVNMRKIRFRQPPGERNALGNIKFMFPNKHSVYLHDTPSRSLFSREVRAFSHGCVRVQDPFALADVLLEGSAWDAQKMKKLIGSRERRIDLAHKIPVHIVYFTADIAPDGSLISRRDIYGHDRKMMAALGLGGQVQASARPR